MRNLKPGLTVLAIAGAAVGAGGVHAGGTIAASKAPTAATTLVTAEGKSVGRVILSEQPKGVLVKATFSGIKPGNYGFHIHTVGKCEKPGFTTAGDHWNPTNKAHGIESPQGSHMGDMLNVKIAESGAGSTEQMIEGATLRGGENPMLDADGAAAVIHAGPDDYKTDPSGNSGARMACGVIAAIVTPAAVG